MVVVVKQSASTKEDGSTIDTLQSVLDNIKHYDARVLVSTIEQAGFVTGSSKATVSYLYKRLVHPIIVKAIEEGRNDISEMLLHRSFLAYALLLPTEEEYNDWIAGFAFVRARYARSRNFNESVDVSHPAKKIGFITRAGPISNSAVDHIFPIIEAMKVDTRCLYDPTLYYMYSVGRDVVERAELHGIEVKVADESGEMAEDRRIDALANMLRSDGVEIAVWTHAHDNVFALFADRIAPIQILFSQYLHPRLPASIVDEKLTYGAPTLSKQIFAGEAWRVIPSCKSRTRAFTRQAEVEKIRQELGASDTLLIGTLARTEKIAQVGFLSCLIRVLKANQNVKFLWTGIQQHADVQREFDRNGVSAQTVFVGWVDIEIYCRVLDVHCDTFPLSNGLTLLESMCAGTACVSTDTALSYFGRDLLPIIEQPWETELPTSVKLALSALHKRNLPIAVDQHGYEAILNSLIRDPAARARNGLLMSTLYREIYSNEALMTTAFVKHLDQIVQGRPPPFDSLAFYMID